MRTLAEVKERIIDIYMWHPLIMGMAAKFAVSLLALLVVRNSIGFNDILSNTLFIVFFSAVCSVMPFSLMLVTMAAYCAVQIFSLSTGLGVVAGVLFAIMYLIFFRFDSKRGYVILLIPLLCVIKLPILIPLVLAVAAPSASAIGVVCGLVSYYFLHYIHIYAPVYQGMTENSTGELKKMSMCLQDLLAYKEMIFTILCVLIMFFVVYYAKKIRVNRSNEMAISTGAGAYLILIIISSMMIGSITYTKLAWFVFTAVVSCLIAMVISNAVLPLDYNRTELLEFEDDEYKYYVRAVPKASVARRNLKIKRIYSRKQHSNRKEKEADL